MTTEEGARAPEPVDGADTSKPAAPRIYDWMLGGTKNFALDREFGKKLLNEFPCYQSCSRPIAGG